MAKLIKCMHMFTYRNTNYLFNGENLRIFTLSDDEKDCILQAKRNNGIFSDIDNNNALFQKLNEEGFFTDREDVLPVDFPKEETANLPITCIELEVANDCNMRCKYCYSEDGSYGCGKDWMTENTAKKCIDFLFDHCGGQNNLSIVFFGGEPLLNFPVIKAATIYANDKAQKCGKNIIYSMTTNATLMTDEIIEYLNQNNVSVTVSIDGPKSVHDKYRVFANGKGSYEVVSKQLNSFFNKYQGSPRARATVSNNCLDLVSLENHFDKMGFEKSTLSLVDTDQTSEMYIPSDSFNSIFQGLENLADKFIDQLCRGDITSNTTFDSCIGSLYAKIPRKKPCGAGTACIAFTASGNIYPCHRFSNLDSYFLGNCYDGWIGSARDLFLNFDVNRRSICQNCYMRKICGGTCLHTAAINTGSINMPSTHYCPVYKKILELCIYIYDKSKEKDENIFDKRFAAYSQALEKFLGNND